MACLHALLIASLGLCMDDEAVRVAVGLHHRAPYATHINAISVGQGWTTGEPLAYIAKRAWDVMPQGKQGIKKSLTSAKISAHLETAGISRMDGKRPDGATVMPWRGRLGYNHYIGNIACTHLLVSNGIHS